METKSKVGQCQKSERKRKMPHCRENLSGHTLGKGLRSRVESGLVWLGPAGCHSPNPIFLFATTTSTPNKTHIRSKAIKLQSPAKRTIFYHRFCQHHPRSFSPTITTVPTQPRCLRPPRETNSVSVSISVSDHGLSLDVCRSPGRGPGVRIPAAG